MPREFPRLLSYSRFVERIPSAIALLEFALLVLCARNASSLSIVDSSLMRVCHPMRSGAHKIFRDFATWGASPAKGFVFGMKLHLVINERGGLVRFALSQAHMADHDEVILGYLAKPLSGLLFGDKGYLSSERFQDLLRDGVKLVTKIRKNMDNVLMVYSEKELLLQRGRIESVFNQLKNGCQIEHTRHRSAKNFLAHLLAGLLAYEVLAENKPAMRLPAEVAASGGDSLAYAALRGVELAWVKLGYAAHTTSGDASGDAAGDAAGDTG